MNCQYCEIIHDNDGTDIAYDGISTVGIASYDQNEVRFVPRKHVRDAAEDPALTAEVISCATQYVAQLRRRPGANRDDGYRITLDIGKTAGQGIFHLSALVVTIPSAGVGAP